MNHALAQTLAEASIVLLKNEHDLLPLNAGQKIAVLGRGQVKTVFSGNGSGASRGQGTAILDALEHEKLAVFQPLAALYREQAAHDHEQTIDWELLAKTGNSGLAYELFGQYHPPREEYAVPPALLEQAAAYTDTALLVLTRNSGGEECDRRLSADYLLTPSEKRLVGEVCGAFARVALVLNINGQMDLGWLEKYPQIQSVLFLGIPGEDGAAALANVLTGQVNPSGRLSFSLFRRYEDCPAAADFSFDREKPLCYRDYRLEGDRGFARHPATVYREGAFGGYRTLGAQPLYPFGWGLSYTRFETAFLSLEKEPGAFCAQVQVTNRGTRPGRHAVLLYQRRTVKKLWGFGKTHLLAPGEQTTLSIRLPYRELLEYDEARARWSVPAGDLHLLLEEQAVASVSVPMEIPGAQVANRLGLQPQHRGKLSFQRAPAAPSCALLPRHKLLISYDMPPQPAQSRPPHPLPDLSEQELAALCVGYGPGVPFSALSSVPLPNTVDGLTVSDHPTGALGYLSPAIPEKGIHSVYYKDGPAGVGGVAWPTEMLLSCSFDRELLYRFGEAIGAECEQQGVDIWLGPAVNLHRNPLCGRNFEYFSEDPLLTGSLAVAVARGVQENHPVLVCPKHFAANEQETCRRGSGKRNYDAVDSIIEEKTLREVYLKPFQMLVQEGKIACIMTAFNRINGTFCGGSRDLCTHILREEWGFQGCVVTDWGDMDTVVDGADAVAAGNDVIMPGGPPVIRQILQGLQEHRVQRKDLETAVSHLLAMIERTRR